MKPSATIVLLCATAFLAPLIGGNIAVFANSLAPGPGALILAIFAGHDAPVLADLIVSLGVLGCLGLLVLRRRVLQAPDPKLGFALVALFGLIAVSIAFSSFRAISTQTCVEWLIYGLAFFAATSGAGRVRGPLAVMSAFSAGCGLTALVGISEWFGMRASDPTWRIFAGWNNPNALAGMLGLGLIVSLGLTVAYRDRASLLAGTCVVATGFALFLTQTRAGIPAALVGVIVFAILAVRRDDVRRFAIPLLTILAICGVAIFGTRAVGSRLVKATSATEQSTAFRMLLWRGAATVIKDNPIGTGIGTYTFASTRSGLTDQTVLAHNSLLQLGVEASPLAPLAFLAVIGFWARAMFSGKRFDPTSIILRAAVLGAVVAAVLDGLVESNLYFFGTGCIVFMLLGLGLQVGSDTVTPEYAPPGLRRSLGLALLVVFGAMAFNAYRDVAKAHVRYDIDNSSDNLGADIAALRPVADGDGEAHYELAFDPTLPDSDRLAEIKLAAELEPSSRHIRTLAEMEVQRGQVPEAMAAFERALANDPNNMLTLSKLLGFQIQQGMNPEAVQTAQRLVAIEDKPIFKIRAISEVVPLQTAEARTFLAGQERDPQKVAQLLQGAVDIYLQYAQISIPYILKNGGGPAVGTPKEILAHLEKGREVANSLAISYRSQGRVVDASEADKASTELGKVLESTTDAFGGNK